MGKNTILVIDDEVSIVKVISTRLKKHGFNVEVAYSGKEALKKVKTEIPDLIILDIMMPEMDGYEVAEKLRENKKTENIPIIMLTAKIEQSDKIKALKMGIDEYITKPYDVEEMTARMEGLLKRSKAVSLKKIDKATVPAISLADKEKLDFIKELLENNIKKIIPEYNMQSLNGYSYKKAADFFKTECGLEIEYLNYLADKQILKKVFFDKILTCPYCFNHNLNIRETAPSDHNVNITLMEMIHHYRCAYVGTEKEFLKGIQYVCPKCNTELEFIGVDYDKPGKMYISNTTGEKFTDPEIFCQCRNCNKSFEADEAVRQDIYTFILTDKATEAVEKGFFSKVDLEQELLDQEINLYNMSYFKTKFNDEINRDTTFKRSFALMLISIDNFDKFLNEHGETSLKKLLKELTLGLKESLWATDTPARFSKNSFITLLPESDKERAENLAVSIKEKIQQFEKQGLEIAIKYACFPEDANTEDSLIELLITKDSI